MASRRSRALVELGRGGDAEVDAADVGLVQHVGVEDLHRDRAAEFGEGGAGLSAIVAGPAGRSGDIEPVEQRFRLVFVVRAVPSRWRTLPRRLWARAELDAGVGEQRSDRCGHPRGSAATAIPASNRARGRA